VVNVRTGQVLPIGTDLLDDLEAHGAGALDVLAAASRVGVPWLIAHGAADESVPCAEAERLAASASGRARLLEVEGAGHTFGVRHPWGGTTAEFDELLKATVGFLAATLE
jgi:pimeloyl-ACP methyl ester carboxylesterase